MLKRPTLKQLLIATALLVATVIIYIAVASPLWWQDVRSRSDSALAQSLGEQYLAGYQVPVNDRKALLYFQRAALLDGRENPYAWKMVGALYSRLGQPKNAIRWYEKGAALNIPDMGFTLAGLYQSSKQWDKAILLYKLLAEQGDYQAAEKLAGLYRVLQQPEAAYYWTWLSYVLGNRDAGFMLSKKVMDADTTLPVELKVTAKNEAFKQVTGWERWAYY